MPCACSYLDCLVLDSDGPVVLLTGCVPDLGLDCPVAPQLDVLGDVVDAESGPVVEDCVGALCEVLDDAGFAD